MIQQVLNKLLIDDLLLTMEGELELDVDEGRRGAVETPLDDLRLDQKQELLNDISTAKADLAEEAEEQPDRENRDDRRGSGKDDRKGDEIPSEAYQKAYFPRSASLSNLQSAIESYFENEKPENIEEAPERRGAQYPAGSALSVWSEYLDYDRRLFGSFEQTDVRWIASKFAEGMRSFRGKHAFVDRPTRKDPIPFDKNARMIVFGDWGSGIPRAQKLASCIRHFLNDGIRENRQQHVIHLGDVYYAGWEFEYRNRFLEYWPVKPAESATIGSFTLNGNHDMYYGGNAYYECALADARFKDWQGKSSLVTMENEHWRLFGLDTAYENKTLNGDQVNWVLTASSARKLKTILLSHHQYCSAYEKAPKGIVEQVEPLLQSVNVRAWWWGHEHRCVTYKGVPLVAFPRCVGHGGVPVYQTRGTQDPVKAPGDYEFRDYIDGGVELWAKFGFVVLDFESERIRARYIDESYLDEGNGKPHHEEIIE